MKNKDKEFDEIKFQNTFRRKFKEAYSINPKKTLHFMKLCLEELGYEETCEYKSLKYKILRFFRNDKKIATICVILFLLIGLCAFEGYVFYYSGSFFFIFYMIFNIFNDDGDNVSKMIFLFTHGLTGLVFMYIGFSVYIYEYLESSKYILCFYTISILLGIFGFIKFILYTLSTNKIFYKSVTLLIFVLGFLILAALNCYIYLRG